MEDLPLGRIAASVPEFAVKELTLGRTLMMIRMHSRKIIKMLKLICIFQNFNFIEYNFQFFNCVSGSFQMLKIEWGAKSNGKLPHLFIPGKTTILVPEFEVKHMLSA